MPNNNPENCHFFGLRRNVYLTTTNDIQMASTMKKAAKEAAVKKGTFYECGWCGKEGTDAFYKTERGSVVCGRMVRKEDRSYCSEKCQYVVISQHNRREALACIDYANGFLDMVRKYVAVFIKEGEQIPPQLLQAARLFNIYKKVMTLTVSGDKPSARKLYDEKKETITDQVEELLASNDGYWSDMYMTFINKFAEVNDMIGQDYVL
jgi:predicted nucleic acid-binding Zn ribbon protein